MLKIALIPEEARGSRQLASWAGKGAALVLEIEGEAVLIERAGGGSLAEMARGGQDEQATAIICRVAEQLHRPAAPLGVELMPLEIWFGPLLCSTENGEDFAFASRTAERLLAEPMAEVSLHGDLHHHNVLEFGAGDWRAIDPKGLRGDRAFDLVHLLRNPDAATAHAPGVLEARASQVAREAKLSRDRLLEWAVAFSALSAIWSIEDGVCPSDDNVLLQRCRVLLNSAGRTE